MSAPKVPYPKAWWRYITICAVLMVLAFANIGLAGALTGWKDDLNGRETAIVLASLAVDAALVGAAFFFAGKAGKYASQREGDKALARMNWLAGFAKAEMDRYPCDEVLNDASWEMRALLRRTKTGYDMILQVFDEETERWRTRETSSHPDMEAVEAYLTEWDFQNRV